MLSQQLYDGMIEVCWNQPRKFQNIVHPARMYIIVIFLPALEPK